MASAGHVIASVGRSDFTALVSEECRLSADTVEKVLCGEHAEFLKAADDLDGFERGGPRQPKQNRSAVFLP